MVQSFIFWIAFYFYMSVIFAGYKGIIKKRKSIKYIMNFKALFKGYESIFEPFELFRTHAGKS